MAWARTLLRTQAAAQPLPLRRVSVSSLLHRPAAPPPRTAVRRWLSEKPPTPPNGDKKPLTRKQIEKAKANADTQEKVWNMLVPERNMTWKSPLFWAVLCGVCYMHYYNGQEAEKEEAKKAELAAMAKANTEKRRAAPPSAAERAEQMAFKQRQLTVWEAKRDAAQRELQEASNNNGSSSNSTSTSGSKSSGGGWGIGWGSSNGSSNGGRGSGGGDAVSVQNGNPAVVARLKHAEARLDALRAGIEELQQQAAVAAEEENAESNRGGAAAP